VLPATALASPQGAGPGQAKVKPKRNRRGRKHNIPHSQPNEGSIRVSRLSAPPAPSSDGHSVLIDGTTTASETADIDRVHEIAGLVQGLTPVRSVVGVDEGLVQRYEDYKQQLPRPDPTIVVAMIAIQYLVGNARTAVARLCETLPLDSMVTMNKLFDQLGDNETIVVSEEYYQILELMDYELMEKNMMRCSDILQLLKMTSYRAAQRMDKINGMVICRELQDLKIDLKMQRLFGQCHRTCPNLLANSRLKNFAISRSQYRKEVAQ
jgi:hypothetical protein